MTLTAWRVVTERYADSAFSGEGARLYGGRWNPKGVALVYTAHTQSLALLEMLVQDSPLRARYVLIPARIPDILIERVDAAKLPADWRELSARAELQQIGAMWARKRTSAVHLRYSLFDVTGPGERDCVDKRCHGALRVQLRLLRG